MIIASCRNRTLIYITRHPNYWYDTDAKLYHLGARWYDPSLYRFISVDPHPGDQDDSQTLNEYLYCRNNPIRYTDPDGEYVETGLDIVSLVYSLNEYKKKPSFKNSGFLGFDTLMLALPIAPGSGVIRGGGRLIKAGDKIEGLSVTEHFAKRAVQRRVTVSQVSKTLKTGRKYYDPKYGTIIIYSSKTKMAVAKKIKGKDRGKLNTVINKLLKPKQRWR